MTSKLSLLLLITLLLSSLVADVWAQPSRIHNSRGRRGIRSSRMQETTPSPQRPPLLPGLGGRSADTPVNPPASEVIGESAQVPPDADYDDYTPVIRFAQRPRPGEPVTPYVARADSSTPSEVAVAEPQAATENNFAENTTGRAPLINPAIQQWLARTVQNDRSTNTNQQTAESNRQAQQNQHSSDEVPAPQLNPQPEAEVASNPSSQQAASPRPTASAPAIIELAGPRVLPSELASPAATALSKPSVLVNNSKSVENSVGAEPKIAAPKPATPPAADIAQHTHNPADTASVVTPKVAEPKITEPHFTAPIAPTAPRPSVLRPAAPAPEVADVAPQVPASPAPPPALPETTRSVVTNRPPPRPAPLPLPQPQPQPRVQAAPLPQVAQTPAAPPQLKLIITGAKRINFGETQPCKAIVSNVGKTAAEDVSVLILLNGQRAQMLPIGVLPAGESRTIPFDLAPQQSGMVGLNAVATASCGVLAVARGTVEVIEQNIELVLAGPRQIRHGEKVDYLLTIRNGGQISAENVAVNVQFGSSSYEGLFQGSLPAGSQREVRFQVLPRQPGFQQLTATALCDGVARGEATADLRVQHGQLQVVASGPSMKLVGTEAIYSVQVKNVGDAPADNVLMTAHLPDGVKFRQGVDKIDFYDGVTWQVGRLDPGEHQSFDLRCELLEAGTREISFVATADDGLRGGQDLALNVAAPAEVQLHVSQPREPITVGQPITYEIAVHNPAARAARNIELAMQLDASVQAIEIDGVPAQITPSGVVFQTIPELAAQQTRRIKVKATAATEGAYPFRVELSVADPNTFVAAEGKTKFIEHAITRGQPAVSPQFERTASERGTGLRR